jgi:hypothetical protein
MHGCIKSTEQFPIQKCEFFCKFKNIEKLRGSQVSWAAQVILQTCHVFSHASGVICAKIAEKSHLPAAIQR